MNKVGDLLNKRHEAIRVTRVRRLEGRDPFIVTACMRPCATLFKSTAVMLATVTSGFTQLQLAVDSDRERHTFSRRHRASCRH